MIGRIRLASFKYCGTWYSWVKPKEGFVIEVSDVIFWCSSYDLTKPLQLTSFQKGVVARINLADKILSFCGLPKDGGEEEEKLLYNCLVYATQVLITLGTGVETQEKKRALVRMMNHYYGTIFC